ncbi:uncharacterized protein PAC_15151 [Phialocephala subalpina]|uniref:DUF6594 domain-containing protein n=1 Tax=Phialocephala subalpina TaxID=576137 RepID=A0A1L7XJN3_9HELO|nr:uncharacterized protein PAC_15151 [Phialocephala subalpina]
MTGSDTRRRTTAAHLSDTTNETGNGTGTSDQDLGQDSKRNSSHSTGSPSAWSLRRLSSTLASSLSKKEKAVKQFNQDHGYDTFVEEKDLDHPKGFPQLASFVSSCDDFSIYRSFRRVHERLILELMVELTDLEKQLDKLDRDDANNPATLPRLHELDPEGEASPKKKLIKEMAEKVTKYDNMVFNHRRMRALGEPAPRNRLSYFNWMAFNRPLSRGSDDFIRHQHDFVNGVGDRSNYFQEAIKDHIYNYPGSIFQWLLKRGNEENKEGSVTYYSEGGLDLLRNALSVSLVVAVLLAPVFLLFLVHMSRVQMVFTAAAFTVPFAVILKMSAAKDVEVFVGTATYVFQFDPRIVLTLLQGMRLF